MSTKECKKCLTTQPVDNFYVITRKDRVKPQLYHRCKSCCSNIKSDSYAYYRDYELRNKYGITLETYKHEVAKRDSVCDVCKTQVKTLHVDHQHTTGKVRGYLCGSCNRGIGLLKDNPDTLMAAARYLEANND